MSVEIGGNEALLDATLFGLLNDVNKHHCQGLEKLICFQRPAVAVRFGMWKIEVIYIKIRFRCAEEEKINKHDDTHERSDHISWISFYYASSIKITLDGDRERRVFEKVMCGYREQDSTSKSSFDPFANPQDSITLISIFHLLIFDILTFTIPIHSFSIFSILSWSEKKSQ